MTQQSREQDLNDAFRKYGQRETSAAVGALALSALGAIGVGGALLVASTLRIAGQDDLATKIDSWIHEMGSAAKDLIDPSTSILNPANWSSHEAEIIQSAFDTHQAFTSQLDQAAPYNPGLLQATSEASDMTLINKALKNIMAELSKIPQDDWCQRLQDKYLRLAQYEADGFYEPSITIAAVRLLIRMNCGGQNPGQPAY